MRLHFWSLIGAVLLAVTWCSAQAQEYPVLQKRLAETQAQSKKLAEENAALKAEMEQLRAKLAEVTAELNSLKVAAGKGADAPAKAKPDDIPLQAGSAISVTFVSVEDAQFGEKITFKIKNTSGKRIKAIKGGLSFHDQFGDRMGHFSAGVTVDDPMAVDEVRVQSGVWPMLDDRIADLLKKSPKDVTLKWETSKVLYEE
jgi:hypothetical protein